MSNKKQTVVFSIAHVYDLIFLLRLSIESNIKERFNVKIFFLEHTYFIGKKKILQKILGQISDDIIYIENKNIPYYKINILKNLYLGYKLKQLLRKNYSKKSFLMIVDKSTLSSNILLSYFKRAALFQFLNNSFNISLYKLNIEKTLVANFLNLMLNNRFIKILKMKNSSKRIEEFIVPHENVSVFYISDNAQEGIKTISFSNMIGQSKKNKKIVMFGSRYLGWNLNHISLQRIKKYYESIFDTFKDEYIFFYVSHPKESGKEFKQINEIFDNRINYVNDSLNSEHFLIENPDIEYCFSIGSTSSKSAYQMGFNSKVAYNYIFEGSDMIAAFDSIFEDLPQDVHIDGEFKNLKDKLKFDKNITCFDTLFKTVEGVE